MSIIKSLNCQSLVGLCTTSTTRPSSSTSRSISTFFVPQEHSHRPTTTISIAFGSIFNRRQRKPNNSWRTSRKTTMNDVSNIHYGPLPEDSPYVKPFRFYYTQNGKEKSWDLLKVHDSVSVVIFNTSRQKLVLVKQFRPAVYHGLVSAEAGADGRSIDMKKYPPSLAVTLELCAGIVDKPIPLAEIAREEVLEECGYDVPVERLEQIISYRSGVGTSGALQVMFYVEVTDQDRVASAGGGVGDEIIEVVEFSLEEAAKLMEKGSVLTSPPAFLFGVLWFLTNRAPKA